MPVADSIFAIASCRDLLQVDRRDRHRSPEQVGRDRRHLRERLADDRQEVDHDGALHDGDLVGRVAVQHRLDALLGEPVRRDPQVGEGLRGDQLLHLGLHEALDRARDRSREERELGALSCRAVWSRSWTPSASKTEAVIWRARYSWTAGSLGSGVTVAT